MNLTMLHILFKREYFASIYIYNVKEVLSNFRSSNFPPICNSSGDMVCDPHKKDESFASRFASDSN